MSVFIIVAALGIVTSVLGDTIPATIRTPTGANYFYIGGDEFSASGQQQAVDAARWTHEVRPGYNNEAQYYTASQSNSFVLNGVLNIVAKKEQFGSQGYTSAFLTSKDLFCVQQNSYTSIRAKIPSGRGNWPALWLLGPYTTPWPATGEIDIMEAVGFTPNTTFTTVHAANTPSGVGISHSSPLPNPYDQYHTFDVYWNSSAIVFLLDGNVTFTVTKSMLGNDWEQSFSRNRCFQVILNNAVGGSWGGQKGIDDSIFPNTLLVDYVRVYSASKSDVFWSPVATQERLEFQLSPCGGNSAATAAGFTQNASLVQIQRNSFNPFIKAITMGAMCNAEYIYVDGGGYLYVAPGGSSSFDIRAVVAVGPKTYQLVQKNGNKILTSEVLQSYAGGRQADAASCCVAVRAAPASVAPPPLSTQRPSTAKPMDWKQSMTVTRSRTVKSKAAKPTTPKPTTAKPTTKPTTAKPTTARPTTAKPTTAKPTTAKPTTPRPTTARPTTARPTTARPTTAKPTTSKPSATVKPSAK